MASLDFLIDIKIPPGAVIPEKTRVGTTQKSAEELPAA